jgi:hypothetical protein
MRTYQAFFNGRSEEIQADSLYAAKCKALEVFKPRKKDVGLVAVVLADTPIHPASI